MCEYDVETTSEVQRCFNVEITYADVEYSVQHCFNVETFWDMTIISRTAAIFEAVSLQSRKDVCRNNTINCIILTVCIVLPGTRRHGHIRILSVPSLPRHGTSEGVFYLLAIRGPTRGECMPRIDPGSPDPQSNPLPLCHCGGPCN